MVKVSNLEHVASLRLSSGYMGVEVPSQYGGADMSFVSSVIVIEELAKVSPVLAPVSHQRMCSHQRASRVPERPTTRQ